MKFDEYDSPTHIDHLHNAPYSSSLATTASASSASVWSNTSSSNADNNTPPTPSSDPDSCDPSFPPRPPEFLTTETKFIDPWINSQARLPLDEAVPAELRQNPRRSSVSSTTRSGCPPPLVRQADRKVNFVENLVDASTQIVLAVWPTSSVKCRGDTGGHCVLPLRTFIQETLRRSKTSFSTLQVALYYLVLIRPHVPEHDFTMEQPDDCDASRALQCGRRMFLAALILASKYLQDRNYSARAWSRISGLAAREIHQNEMAFLIAVNWRLHVTVDLYNQWTDVLTRFTPPPPPSPGSPWQLLYERKCQEFRKVVLGLSPELDNIGHVAPRTPISARSRDLSALSPRWPQSAHSEKSYVSAYEPSELTPTGKCFGTPNIMEPPTTVISTPGRMAPAMGLLPTPRLTPQPGGFGTPAVSAVPSLLGKGSAMGFAMNQASSIAAAQALDRWPASATSPQAHLATRRSSLANSISTASSPESMISDSSRCSRASSIASASSLVSAPPSKLDVQARFRSAKLCGERFSLGPTIVSVPEDCPQDCFTSSPESYTGLVGKDIGELSLETPLGRRGREMADNDAARALQQLQHPRTAPAVRPSLKRSRPMSEDNILQDNVREIMRGQAKSEAPWPDTLVRPALGARFESEPLQASAGSALGGSRKRLRSSNEATQTYNVDLVHPSMSGIAGPGMWEGILN